MVKKKDAAKKDNLISKSDGDKEPTVKIPISELDRYRTAIIVQESKEEIKKWAKNRITILAIIFGCLGFLGFPTITFVAFQKYFNDEISDLKETNSKTKDEMIKATVLAEVSIDKMKEATKKAEEYTEEITELKEQTDNVGSELDLLSGEITSISKADWIKGISGQEFIDQKLEALEKSVSALAVGLKETRIRDGDSNSNLTDMANDREPNDVLIAGISENQYYAKIIDSLNKVTKEIESDAKIKQKEFEENSLYKITVIYDHLSAKTNPLLEIITDLIRNKGYIPIFYNDIKYNDMYVQKIKHTFSDNMKPNHVMVIGNKTISGKMISLVNLIEKESTFKELGIKVDIHERNQFGPHGQLINKNLILVYLPSI